MFAGQLRFLYLLPAIVFVVLCGFLLRGLSLDPSLVPTALIDKPVPFFELDELDDQTNPLSSENLKGKVTLVNVFSSCWLEFAAGTAFYRRCYERIRFSPEKV